MMRWSRIIQHQRQKQKVTVRIVYQTRKRSLQPNRDTLTLGKLESAINFLRSQPLKWSYQKVEINHPVVRKWVARSRKRESLPPDF